MERVKSAGQISRIFYTTVNSLLVAQGGERRAHGFDY
jgi:hypothetical protein